MTTVIIDLQIATDFKSLPSLKQLQTWAELALAKHPNMEIGIRLVDDAESAHLNKTYRNKSGPTNVLSFPFANSAEINSCYLGDLVLCAPLIAKEAQAQGKSLESHFAHLVIHGILHLLGHDHATEPEAKIMETQEIALMAAAGYSDPYEEV